MELREIVEDMEKKYNELDKESGIVRVNYEQTLSMLEELKIDH